MGDYAVTTPAYVKMLLHAAKRPANSVCGLLLGQEQGQGFSITDVVPLFHHEAPLAPLLEVGCSMADVWSQQTSKKIVGFYYAGSGSTPAEGGSGISHFAEKVADKVEANCSRSCVLVVDNQQLNNETKIGLQLLLKDVKRGWTRVENRLHVASGATKMLSSGLQQGIERDIVDFEDHLEDTAKDWRNPHVVSLLKLNV